MTTSREEPGEGGHQQGFVRVYQVLFSTQRRGTLQTSMQTTTSWWLGHGG